MVLFFFTMEEEKRIYKKWEVVDKGYVKRSVSLQVIPAYVKCITEEIGHAYP